MKESSNSALPSPTRSARSLDYVALLGKWNAVYNLTAIRDRARC